MKRGRPRLAGGKQVLPPPFPPHALGAQQELNHAASVLSEVAPIDAKCSQKEEICGGDED